MSLVSIDSLLRQVLQMVKKIEPPAGLEMLTYKRNRGIAVTVMKNEEYRVREYGYEEQELVVHDDELARILKPMIKREFPRSRKVRINKFADPAELDRPRNTI